MHPFPSIHLLSSFAPVKPIPGCNGIVAQQAENVFDLWHAWETEIGKECDVPYWAAVWPASIILARYILDHPDMVAGKTILDIGCGAGVAAIACVKAGAASVIASDIDPSALHVAGLNAIANGVDITFDETDLVSNNIQKECDLIFAADMFYHKTQAQAMLQYLQQARKNGIRVIISDAERPFTPRNGLKLLAAEIVSVNKELEGSAQRKVQILEML